MTLSHTGVKGKATWYTSPHPVLSLLSLTHPSAWADIPQDWWCVRSKCLSGEWVQHGCSPQAVGDLILPASQLCVSWESLLSLRPARSRPIHWIGLRSLA